MTAGSTMFSLKHPRPISTSFFPYRHLNSRAFAYLVLTPSSASMSAPRLSFPHGLARRFRSPITPSLLFQVVQSRKCSITMLHPPTICAAAYFALFRCLPLFLFSFVSSIRSFRIQGRDLVPSFVPPSAVDSRFLHSFLVLTSTFVQKKWQSLPR